MTPTDFGTMNVTVAQAEEMYQRGECTLMELDAVRRRRITTLTTTNLSALLASLGDTPDAVAATLTAAGVKGGKRKPCDCPVSNHITAQTGRPCAVGDLVCWLYPVGKSGDYWNAVKVRAPLAVTKFVAEFDAGAYPELVEE